MSPVRRSGSKVYRHTMTSRSSLPSPVNVKDPRTDAYTIAVVPCQNIQLFLSNPVDVFKDADASDEWEIKTYSNYFYLEGTYASSGKKQFNFIQYYNVTPWTDCTSLYLGNIEITLNSKNAVCESFSLCVIARNPTKQSRIVTAVNPIVDRIKLDLDEILEVVTTREADVSKKDEVWCSLYDMGRSGTGNGSQWFEKLRQETVILPDSFAMPYDPGNIYLTMSRSISSLPKNPGLPDIAVLPTPPVEKIKSQHHFWFRIRPEDKSAVLRANIGKPMANIVFNGTSGSCSNLQVIVNSRGTRQEPLVSTFDKDRYDGSYRGLVGRHYCPSAGLLVNPSKAETAVEIMPDQEGVIIEFSPPQMTWPYTDSTQKWCFNIEPVMDGGHVKSEHHRITCTELTERSINQQSIQRFLITTACKIPDVDKMLYLGVVSFWCKEPSVISKRTINFWLVRTRTVKDEYDNLDSDHHKELLLPRSQKTRGKVREVLSTQPVNKVMALPPYKKPVKYDRVIVRITELNDDNMITPCSVTVPFQEIKVETSGKKEAYVTGTVQGKYDNFDNQKKNDIKIEKESLQKTNRTSPSFSGGSTNVAKAQNDHARLLSDPNPNTVIELSPGQEFVIRLPIKNWEMKEDVGFFWMFNIIQFKQNQFFIKSQNLIREGRRLFQEIVISLLTRNIPHELGTYLVGGIQCMNRHETRYIGIKVVVSDINFSDTNLHYVQTLRCLMASLKASRESTATLDVNNNSTERENIVELEKNLDFEKTTKSRLIHDPRVVQSIVTQLGNLTKLSINELRENAQQKIESRKQKSSVPTCVMLENPSSGEYVVLDNNKTLKVTLSKVLNGEGKVGMGEQWICCGTPKWLDLSETTTCNGKKSFLFKINDVASKSTDEIQFKCNKDIRIVRVHWTLEESSIILA
jgi:hypothetical protein